MQIMGLEQNFVEGASLRKMLGWLQMGGLFTSMLPPPLCRQGFSTPSTDTQAAADNEVAEWTRHVL